MQTIAFLVDVQSSKRQWVQTYLCFPGRFIHHHSIQFMCRSPCRQTHGLLDGIVQSRQDPTLQVSMTFGVGVGLSLGPYSRFERSFAPWFGERERLKRRPTNISDVNERAVIALYGPAASTASTQFGWIRPPSSEELSFSPWE